MAVFTTIQKQRLSWPAPPPVQQTEEAYELLISDEYKLTIGDTFNLTIKPEVTAIQYTTVSKSQGGHTWPSAVSTNVDQFINIGGGFNLLIDSTNQLITDGAEGGGSVWTPISRNPLSF